MTETLKPWGTKEKADWRAEQTIKRSYQSEVLTKIEKLKSTLDVVQYGALSYNKDLYPVFLIKTRNFDKNKKTILVTGGVHGYETSGVHGALSFMESIVHQYTEQFNVVCAPCISPWGYETINRWNPLALDPNRNFFANSPSEECSLFLSAMTNLGTHFYAHFDLHETTDTDNSIFRIAKQQRDGQIEEWTEIPDGFYTVGDSEKPVPEFQKAIIQSVKKVTHIAPPDDQGRFIGEKLEQEGVINYPVRELFLCSAFSGAPFTTTTEVYPDSPKVTDEICNKAQVAAITGGLDYLKNL